MKKNPPGIIYSATDLSNFLECEHLTAMDRINLDHPMKKSVVDEMGSLMQEKGIAHEKNYVDRLKKKHKSFVDINEIAKNNESKAPATLEAMKDGVEIIYQAALNEGNLGGFSDFLRRVDRPSGLGKFSYEVVDAKLAYSGKSKFLIQLAFYSDLVTGIQKLQPHKMHLVLGNGTEQSYRVSDYFHYYQKLKARFFDSVSNPTANETYPNPCGHCDYCQWNDLCKERRIKDDHLSLVANISRLQIKRLNGVGIQTLEQLANSKDKPTKLKLKIQDSSFKRLNHQASLQFRARESGKRIFELLDEQEDREEGLRGFTRLPKPHSGDLFFDMEGNPLELGGLEYLFGLLYLKDKKPVYKHFWAHSREEEKGSFEGFMDFVTDHLQKNPGAHIYHYAGYEKTALKKLMSLHATRESQVDDLLRQGKLIDLFQVVREAVRVSEPRYSIKNIEHFYMKDREGDVTDAGASIVYYEKWKMLKTPKLLSDIKDYNKVDLDSTQKLRDWLLEIGSKFVGGENVTDAEPVDAKERVKSLKIIEREEKIEGYRKKLMSGLPANLIDWNDEDRLKELTFHLMDFHRREAKPQYWAIYDRQQMTYEERLDDDLCIAGCEMISQDPDPNSPSSIRYTFRYPEQETKLKDGSKCLNINTLENLGEIEVDYDKKEVSFHLSKNRQKPEKVIDIGQGWPVDTSRLEGTVERYVDDYLQSLGGGERRYKAVSSFLKREIPKIKSSAHGKPLVDEELDSKARLSKIVEAVLNMEKSCLFIQGPPGAGKTFTGSRIIVELIAQGKKVGITSNSHKAIINLLKAIEGAAKESGLKFRGVKKSSDDEDTLHLGEQIENVTDNKKAIGKITSGYCSLIAGTAWLFADANIDQQLDYLFIDEAGQVSLANLLAVGTSASNIVLLGDQMQLAQPIQGVHPGQSGLSALDYLLEGNATVAPEKGIFLATTFRLHPDICEFISEAVYEGRLKPEKRTTKRVIVLDGKTDPALAPSGIRYVPVDHDGCSQFSDEEIKRVSEIFNSLMKVSYIDEKGEKKPMGYENILIVSPYNMQVNKLTDALPKSARVGTVDKFQGQEAEAVIISMATSSADFLPRNIEFLFSKNRLNVAVSRAKCLAILVANPALLTIPCKTPEQMALVNTLCWVAQ